MDEAKIYNVCLQRVKFQITKAKQRLNSSETGEGRKILESYCTGDVDEIIDILELYDLESLDRNGLHEKLEDLAYTVSVMVRESITFDYDENGQLGLYLDLKRSPEEECDGTDAALAAAVQG